MAHRFIVQDSSPAPSTPDKRQPGGFGFSYVADNPTTTPAGPPPSSVASFTPAGAPTESFLGSSMMGGKSMSFGSTQHQKASGRQLFSGAGGKANTPVGKPIGGGRGRQPSGLSQQFSISDEEAEQDMDAEGEEELPPHPGSLFRNSSIFRQTIEEDAEGDDVDAEIERYMAEELEAEQDAEGEYQEAGNDHEGDRMPRDGSEEGDMFLNMRHDDRPYGQPIIGEADDLMMLNTPGATDRVRREAESIFRRSSARHGTSTRARDFQFATIARDIYTQHEPARITETPELIIKTEGLVCRLYDEGIGAVDDAEKMDNSLANIAYKLVELWNDQVENLPQPEGEDFATVGPGPEADPFEKAAYLAHLVLRMHHTRFEGDTGDENTPPLPEILFNWMQTSHNLYPDQVREISRYKPSPACHNMYWQTLRNTLLRGDVAGAVQLLKNAGWENVRKGTRGDRAYTGKALENVRRFANAACEVLERSPAMRADWEVWSSSWTLFRVQAKGSLDRLTLFAEGRDVQFSESFDDDMPPRQQSISTMARKASSQIPWDFYENLQTLYGIVLGNHEAILDTAQDWCEATVGLFGWWEDDSQHHTHLRLSHTRSMRNSQQFSVSSEYFDRLAAAFRLVVDSDLRPNPLNAVEVAIASAFEGNVNAVISLLRIWSLPVAASVAEVASLGAWLPPPEKVKPLPMDTLDMDDLALLGVLPPSADEIEGIKDTTLVMYARELAGIEHLSTHREGWEVAIQVLGRMDVPENSEETVGELLRDLLATLDVNSRPMVDRMWRILNDLGMIVFAEETAHAFAEILCRESHRYGEALWYFALSHRADNVRDILNLLISYSLIQSTAFPPEQDLDEDLRRLLRERTETLETKAKQDLEAAQLLGRLLSGYATLRKFYEMRDEQTLETMPHSKAVAMKKQAAAALTAVISSADDNIRGGLYDETRDAVVSEDFLLALLGEATAFVDQTPAIISLEQIDIILKAVEDLQTVGSSIYEGCDQFFQAVLSSGQGLKGSAPADLMKKSTSSLSGSSYVMSGSSMLASHIHESTGSVGKPNRGWDWRKAWQTSTVSKDVLRKLRLSLSRDLASLWLEDADGATAY